MNLNFNVDDLVREKINAIKKVYRDWGYILRRALRKLTPVDRGTLRREIRLRVESPKSRKDITGTVRLLVGVLNPDSPVLLYLKYVVKGNHRPHFVPVITKEGRSTGILGWAQRHDLVYYGRSLNGEGRSDWRWAKGDFKGRLFYGIKVFQRGNDMFNRVYESYYNDIQSDVERILRSE